MNEEKKHHSMSGWTDFLNKDLDDPYSVFKDNVTYQLEQVILNVQNTLLKTGSDYSKEKALQMAICLVMERMLVLQHEHFPKSMDAMTASLFAELPGLSDFRIELLELTEKKVKEKTLLGRLKKWNPFKK